MKPSASRIERMLAKVEAKVAPPPRVRLSVMIDDTDDEAERKKKQEKALAEHIAAHPEDAGRTVADFNWIVNEIVRSWPMPGTQGAFGKIRNGCAFWGAGAPPLFYFEESEQSERRLRAETNRSAA